MGFSRKREIFMKKRGPEIWMISSHGHENVKLVLNVGVSCHEYEI